MKMESSFAVAFALAIATVAAYASDSAQQPGQMMASTNSAAPTGIAGLGATKWGPPPPALPPGVKFAVMSGDPASNGFVSMRAKMPPGYTVPPHFHSSDEHVTVLSGTLLFAMADKVDPKAETAFKTCGYFVAKANMHHYARTVSGAVVQIDLIGPFSITYLNPADDPRKSTAHP
jgi:quercetin dioxygenase-like cupin family protein